MTIAGPEALGVEDVWRITTPLPYRPRSVHAYLVRTEEGFVLVDGGGDTDEGWAVLDAAVSRLSGWDRLRLHLITHMHVDHVGLAGRVGRASGAPVMMGRLDAERRAHASLDPAEEALYRSALLRRAGAPDAVIERMSRPHGRGHEPYPSITHLPDEHVSAWPELPGWTVLWTPGHTAGHLAIQRAADGVLICGDTVLDRVTPTVGLNRQRDDPVTDYLDSLARLASMKPRLALGGHGSALPDPLARINDLKTETSAESERILRSMDEVPVSIWTLVERRYAGRDLPDVMWYQAIREVGAHLAHLVARGRAQRVPGAVEHYVPIRELA